MTRIVRGDLPALLPGAALAGIVLWWTLAGGGYAPTTWLPGTLAVLGLLVVVLVAVPRLRRPRPGTLVALAAFALYAVWSYLSVLWADNAGVALEGSHRTLLFGLCLALGIAIPWTVAAARWTLLLVAAALIAAGVVTTIRLGAAAGAELFVNARLSSPLGYQNADAALWTVGAVLATVLASRRETWAPLRPPLLAGAGVLLALAVLSQSRGWLFALPVIAIAVVALCPGRVRLALFATPVVAAVAVALEALLEPFRAGRDTLGQEATAPLTAAAADAAAAIGLVGAALLVAGVAALAVDARVRPSERLRRAAGRAGAAVAAALLAVAAASALVAADGAPVQRVEDAWADFRDFEDVQTGDSRFASLGSTRYDFWRVSLDLVGEHPVAGIGQDNFAQPYVERRRAAAEEPRWTHSLPLRLLVHTGIVGALLFAAAVAGVAWAAWAPLRAGPRVAAVAAAGLVPLVVWLVHGAIDWLWEFPALSGPALALAGMVAAMPVEDRPGATAPPAARPPRGVRLGAAAAGGLAAIAAAGAIGAAWIAARDVEWAARDWQQDPAAALGRLDRAADLAPLAVDPPIVEGVIEMYRGRPERARAAFAEAVRRAPGDWLPRLQLGLAASAAGDIAAARAAFRAARVRSPHDPLLAEALRRAGTRRPLGYREAQADLRRRVSRRVNG